MSPPWHVDLVDYCLDTGGCFFSESFLKLRPNMPRVDPTSPPKFKPCDRLQSSSRGSFLKTENLSSNHSEMTNSWWRGGCLSSGWHSSTFTVWTMCKHHVQYCCRSSQHDKNVTESSKSTGTWAHTTSNTSNKTVKTSSRMLSSEYFDVALGFNRCSLVDKDVIKNREKGPRQVYYPLKTLTLL